MFVLVIKNDYSKGSHGFGPYLDRTAAEFAAMDYYGTAITGASARDEFQIVEVTELTPELIRQRTERP